MKSFKFLSLAAVLLFQVGALAQVKVASNNSTGTQAATLKPVGAGGVGHLVEVADTKSPMNLECWFNEYPEGSQGNNYKIDALLKQTSYGIPMASLNAPSKILGSLNEKNEFVPRFSYKADAKIKNGQNVVYATITDIQSGISTTGVMFNTEASGKRADVEMTDSKSGQSVNMDCFVQ